MGATLAVMHLALTMQILAYILNFLLLHTAKHLIFLNSCIVSHTHLHGFLYLTSSPPTRLRHLQSCAKTSSVKQPATQTYLLLQCLCPGSKVPSPQASAQLRNICWEHWKCLSKLRHLPGSTRSMPLSPPFCRFLLTW